jgi:hypothetical protein
VRRRLLWIGGAVTVAGGAVYRALRRRGGSEPAVDSPAEALREKLEESRAIVTERDEFESAETTVDRAEPGGVEERRRAVHERGKAAADDMRAREKE